MYSKRKERDFRTPVLNIKLWDPIFIHQCREDSERRAGFCNNCNCHCCADTVLTFLHLEIVQQGCKDILGPNSFSNIAKCVDCCSSNTLLMGFKHLEKFKQILIHSLAGVNRGSKSLMGGVILVIPITFTIAFRAPRIDPRTSGYSSPNLLSHFSTLIVQTPLYCTTDLGEVGLHPLSKGIHNSTKSIEHYIGIITGLFLESIKNAINQKLF
nr:hypothetical protein TorRG33x02_088080 [Ipomoea batatas]